MEAIKEYINTPSKLKKIIRFMDGLALRYVPMFFILAIANGLVIKIMFNQTVSNKFTTFFLIITAVAVSLLWTRLAIKTELSVFDYSLPPRIKKKALSRRGANIVIFYLLLQLVRSSELSSDILLIISRKLMEFSFAITILVLIVTFIIIALRKPQSR